jgi:two-component system, OmpR family, phosphate regulon sensor histidine kinase PhoR
MARILIIDDDSHMRMACARVLSKAGHTVTCAETGEEGLNAIGNGVDPFDAVLLDQLMPGMSGMDTLAAIKAKAQNLRVIIITGSATEETAVELQKQGACDCLPKPFNPEQLRNAIQKALRFSF